MALIIESWGQVVKGLGISGIELGIRSGMGIEGTKGVFIGGGVCSRESATIGDVRGAKPL